MVRIAQFPKKHIKELLTCRGFNLNFIYIHKQMNKDQYVCQKI